MATRKGCSPRPSYRFLIGEKESLYSIGTNNNDDPLVELDEFEMWNSGRDPRRSNGYGSRAAMKKSASMTRVVEEGGGFVFAGGSLPVNVPDWSKILSGDSRRRKFGGGCGTDEEKYEDAEYGVPPHEVVARRTRRRKVASYSVHEGIGRTLKGRDLSRVRNAIWEKTGFQD